jgi:ectoine hydroxylase-related dioxygenase (phytanoyl-CoA dioxygenase family)
MKNLTEEISERGFAILENIISIDFTDEIIAALERIQLTAEVKQRAGKAYGIRRLLDVVPEIRTLAESENLRKLIEPTLGKNARVVRGILFDKNPVANWKVPWHQDVVIALREKKEVAGFSAWSTKAGIIHAQPPAEILENILAVRIHLDDADETNGALRVIPGSHKLGLLSDQQINLIKGTNEEVTCRVAKSGALLMRPLLLHASSVATNPTHRRIIHLEFTAQNLPDGLEWYGS